MGGTNDMRCSVQGTHEAPRVQDVEQRSLFYDPDCCTVLYSTMHEAPRVQDVQQYGT